MPAWGRHLRRLGRIDLRRQVRHLIEQAQAAFLKPPQHEVVKRDVVRQTVD